MAGAKGITCRVHSTLLPLKELECKRPNWNGLEGKTEVKWKSGRRGLAWLWGWGGEELNTCSCCFLSSLVAFDIPLFIELIFVLHCSHISLIRKLLLSSFTQILFLNMPNHSCPQILCISKKIYQSNREFRDLAWATCGGGANSLCCLLLPPKIGCTKSIDTQRNMRRTLWIK